MRTVLSRAVRYAAVLLALATVCGASLAGFLAGPVLASGHPAVRLYRASLSAQPGSPEADAARVSGALPEEAAEEAARVVAKFRAGGALFGGWCAMVALMHMAGAATHRARTEYEIDRKICVSCARCFSSCPQGTQPRKTTIRAGTPG